jgi:S1-C subfamily serine protease
MLLGFCLGFGLLGADEPPDLQQAVALQKVMQKVIRDVEPAIACILVSRSDAYQRFVPKAEPAYPGQLGSFHPDLLEHGTLPADELANLRKRLDLADAGHVPESFGSGVVIDEGGLVLTSFHVVQGATKVFVRLPGNKSSYADIHAADARSDLAVLRLLAPNLKLKTIRMGDTEDIERGQFVLSIANPFAAGFRDGRPSASWGIISNLRRRAPGTLREIDRVKTLHHYGTLIQTDARLHLGCSGGALLNLRGEMIGLTTALAAIHGGETPGGFAVPMDAGMQRIVEVLRRGEEVEYGFLGVAFQERSRDRRPGVALAHVTRGSPAKLEGRLADDDVIVRVNGVAVQDSDDLFLMLGTQLAGSRVTLEVQKATGDRVHVAVTLARFHVPGPAIAASKGRRPVVRGLRVDYTSLLVQQPPRLSSIPAGVLISEVHPHTSASMAQLKVGEVITHVAGRAVNTPAAFYQMFATLKGPVELTLAGSPGETPPKVMLP